MQAHVHSVGRQSVTHSACGQLAGSLSRQDLLVHRPSDALFFGRKCCLGAVQEAPSYHGLAEGSNVWGPHHPQAA